MAYIWLWVHFMWHPFKVFTENLWLMLCLGSKWRDEHNRSLYQLYILHLPSIWSWYRSLDQQRGRRYLSNWHVMTSSIILNNRDVLHFNKWTRVIWWHESGFKILFHKIVNFLNWLSFGDDLLLLALRTYERKRLIKFEGLVPNEQKVVYTELKGTSLTVDRVRQGFK